MLASRVLRDVATTAAPTATLIPVAKGLWPLLGHLPVFAKAKGNLGAALRTLHATSGDTFRFRVPGEEMIVTRDPELTRRVLMTQGEYATRGTVVPWERTFQRQGWPQGIPWAQGEDWKRYRRILGETMVSVAGARPYLGVSMRRARRLVNALQAHLVPDPHAPTKLRLAPNADLRQLYGLFALESVEEMVLAVDSDYFPRSPSEAIRPDVVAFIKAVETMLDLLMEADNVVQKNLPWRSKAYRKNEEMWLRMVEFVTKETRPVLDRYNRTKQWPAGFESSTILPKLVAQIDSGELTEEEVVMIGVQAISAAVDTTAQTLEFLTYNLASNPTAQQRLVQEVGKIAPHLVCRTATDTFFAPGTAADDAKRIAPGWVEPHQWDAMVYLRAAVRESMRLTPTVGLHVRELVDQLTYKDAASGATFLLPKGSRVMMNYGDMAHNDRLVGGEAARFQPERFLRGEEGAAARCPKTNEEGAAPRRCPYHPYAAGIPFGHGARKCAGAGFAQNQVQVGALSVFSAFDIGYDGAPFAINQMALSRSAVPISKGLYFKKRVTTSHNEK